MPGESGQCARQLGRREQGRNPTDIFITRGHDDHWFAAGLPGARALASQVGSLTRSWPSIAKRLPWAVTVVTGDGGMPGYTLSQTNDRAAT